MRDEVMRDEVMRDEVMRDVIIESIWGARCQGISFTLFLFLFLG